MENKYRHTKNTISHITYHFVFCPRYRRKIFEIPGVEQRFKELTTEKCLEHKIEIVEMECHEDYVYMCVNVDPSMTIISIMQTIKGATSVKLRKEFTKLSAMNNLWTRKFFVTTEECVSDETIQWYVKSQKTRP